MSTSRVLRYPRFLVSHSYALALCPLHFNKHTVVVAVDIKTVGMIGYPYLSSEKYLVSFIFVKGLSSVECQDVAFLSRYLSKGDLLKGKGNWES